MAFRVKIGTFSDDAADIEVDGKVVGWLERVYDERFRSASSRARVKSVSHYSINLTDDVVDELLDKQDVGSRAEARAEVQRAFERAFVAEQISTSGTSGGAKA